jgi:hypothetical protein
MLPFVFRRAVQPMSGLFLFFAFRAQLSFIFVADYLFKNSGVCAMCLSLHHHEDPSEALIYSIKGIEFPGSDEGGIVDS